jgi:hypothetical protein
LAIVIVKRSLEAANAIIAGNNVNLIASLNMTPSDIVCVPDYAMEVESALLKCSPRGRQNEKGSDLSPEPFCIIALKQAEIT